MSQHVQIKYAGSGGYMGCFNPEQVLSKLIDHYLQVNGSRGDEIQAMVISPKDGWNNPFCKKLMEL